jgi:hypothetical protein
MYVTNPTVRMKLKPKFSSPKPIRIIYPESLLNPLPDEIDPCRIFLAEKNRLKSLPSKADLYVNLQFLIS